MVEIVRAVTKLAVGVTVEPILIVPQFNVPDPVIA